MNTTEKLYTKTLIEQSPFSRKLLVFCTMLGYRRIRQSYSNLKKTGYRLYRVFKGPFSHTLLKIQRLVYVKTFRITEVNHMIVNCSLCDLIQIYIIIWVLKTIF